MKTVLCYLRGDAKKAMDAVSGMTTDERRDELKRRAEQRAAAATDWGTDENARANGLTEEG